ncbi:EAL domain-containing protein [Pseudomonas sp. NPDC089734]|uniref:EAL domain-containing protein n=1 Tax=Pseudomonas sp. NPDC089734 TaxID=3364469 RepID=UPI00382D08D6
MRRKTMRSLATASAVLIFIVCTGIFVFLAVQSGHKAALTYLNGITSDVIHRSTTTQAQVNEAVKAQRNAGLTPCSPEHLALMQSLTLKASYLQALAFIQGDRLICSTLRAQDDEVDLGPASHHTLTSGRRWSRVTLPEIPGTVFVINENGGYAAIIEPSLVLDVASDQPDISITHFRNSDGVIVRTRGKFKPEWLTHYQNQPVAFFDEGDFVFIQPSSDKDSSVLATMPDKRVESLILQALPGYLAAGLLLGLLFALSIYVVARRKLSFKSQLQGALKRREFSLVYQPVIDLRTGQCAGAEALIRWNQAERGFISPVEFIPAAEALGLIKQVTAQVMEIVAKESAQLIKDNPETHIAINFSAEDLHSEETEKRLQALISESGGTSHNILIEATERGLMVPDKAKEVLVSIRAKGFKVAIDDFGTGNSSLSYLSTYDLDYLKIDKSFVDKIGDDPASSPILFHIIGIARSLGLKMIAEGVETEYQRNVLRDAGVHMAQGWYFGKPMPIAELIAFINQSKTQSGEATLENGESQSGVLS